MIKNAVGRYLPEKAGSYIIKPYEGLDNYKPSDNPIVTKRTQGSLKADDIKLSATIEDAVNACGLKDGMTISFHHSFREGDLIIGQVLEAIRNLGIKGLKFAPSAVVNIKNPSIVDFVKDGTISKIEASGIRGELGDAVMDGLLDEPVI